MLKQKDSRGEESVKGNNYEIKRQRRWRRNQNLILGVLVLTGVCVLIYFKFLCTFLKS